MADASEDFEVVVCSICAEIGVVQLCVGETKRRAFEHHDAHMIECHPSYL